MDRALGCSVAIRPDLWQSNLEDVICQLLSPTE